MYISGKLKILIFLSYFALLDLEVFEMEILPSLQVPELFPEMHLPGRALLVPHQRLYAFSALREVWWKGKNVIIAASLFPPFSSCLWRTRPSILCTALLKSAFCLSVLTSICFAPAGCFSQVALIPSLFAQEGFSSWLYSPAHSLSETFASSASTVFLPVLQRRNNV